VNPPLDISGAAEALGVCRRSLEYALESPDLGMFYELRGRKKVFYPEHILALKKIIGAPSPTIKGEGTDTDEATAVYRYFSENGVLLYVGMSKRVAARMSQHKGQEWDKLVSSIKVDWFATRELAKAEETRAILEEYPLFNKANSHKDLDWE
jgi:predicted GIY-YIG superfamily endonuclease